MKLLPHPTHASTTRKLATLFLLLAAIFWIVGFFWSDGNSESTRSILLSLFMIISGTLALFVLFLRAYLCNCPSCSRWLTIQEKVDIDETSRRFICRHCGVTWDSKVKLSH